MRSTITFEVEVEHDGLLNRQSIIRNIERHISKVREVTEITGIGTRNN